jgi:hypothetical protein
MPEIGQSGSEGGAKKPLSLPLSAWPLDTTQIEERQRGLPRETASHQARPGLVRYRLAPPRGGQLTSKANRT